MSNVKKISDAGNYQGEARSQINLGLQSAKDVQDPTSRRKVRNKRSSRYGLVSALNPIEKPLGSTERSLRELLKKSRWYCVRDRDQLGDFREHGGAVKKSTMQKKTHSG